MTRREGARQDPTCRGAGGALSGLIGPRAEGGQRGLPFSLSLRPGLRYLAARVPPFFGLFFSFLNTLADGHPMGSFLVNGPFSRWLLCSWRRSYLCRSLRQRPRGFSVKGGMCVGVACIRVATVVFVCGISLGLRGRVFWYLLDGRLSPIPSRLSPGTDVAGCPELCAGPRDGASRLGAPTATGRLRLSSLCLSTAPGTRPVRSEM